MAIQTITYGDKSYLNELPDIPATNKVQDVDMNEIKSVVNNNATELSNIKLKLLWSNSNPTSNFDAQNITLSNSDYDYLRIFFKGTASQTTVKSTDTLKGYGFLLDYASDARQAGGMSDYYGATMVRICTRISDTEFSIPVATVKLGNSTTPNTDDAKAYCIPIAIYGAKF